MFTVREFPISINKISSSNDKKHNRDEKIENRGRMKKKKIGKKMRLWKLMKNDTETE